MGSTATTRTLTLTQGTGLGNSSDTFDNNAVISSLENAQGIDGAGLVAAATAISNAPSLDDALASQSGIASKAAINSAGSALEQVSGIVQARITPGSNNTDLSSSSGISSGDVTTIEPAAGGQGYERRYWVEAVGGFGEIDSDNRGRGADYTCLLYTSPSPRDQRGSRMPSSA